MTGKKCEYEEKKKNSLGELEIVTDLRRAFAERTKAWETSEESSYIIYTCVYIV